MSWCLWLWVDGCVGGCVCVCVWVDVCVHLSACVLPGYYVSRIFQGIWFSNRKKQPQLKPKKKRIEVDCNAGILKQDPNTQTVDRNLILMSQSKMGTFSEHRVISSSKQQKQALKKGLALKIFFFFWYLPIKINILFNSFSDKSFVATNTCL